MSITNTSKPTTALVNATKIATGETWDTEPATWANETRTWDATGSLLTNATKQSSSITNIAKPV